MKKTKEKTWSGHPLSSGCLDVWPQVTSVRNYIGSLLSPSWNRCDLLLKLAGIYEPMLWVLGVRATFSGADILTHTLYKRYPAGDKNIYKVCVFLQMKFFICCYTWTQNLFPVKTDGQWNYALFIILNTFVSLDIYELFVLLVFVLIINTVFWVFLVWPCLNMSIHLAENLHLLQFSLLCGKYVY